MRELLFLICILPLFASAQSTVNQDLSGAAELPLKEDEIISEETSTESFRFFLENKVNLNSAEINLLTEAGLISYDQQCAITAHIRKFGKLLSVEELQVINRIDRATLSRLKNYV